MLDREVEPVAEPTQEDIEIERSWDERFARSQEKLSELAKLARERAARGDVFDFDPSDRLKR